MNSRSRTSIFLILILLTISASAAEKRNITEKDIFQVNWAADPQISPDGSQVVFVKVSVNEKEDKYETSLWSVSTSGSSEPQRLTNGPRDSGPRWSPDGKRLAFNRSTEKDGKPQPAQIFILNFTGGEPWALTTLPKGAQGAKWSPDGTKIAFSSSTIKSDLDKPTTKDKSEHESDVRVISRAVYRSNGEGYLDPKRADHIWVVAAPEKPEDPLRTASQLTFGNYDEGEITWSPDGSTVYFSSNRVPEPYYEFPQDAIYAVPASGGEIKRVAGIDGGSGDISLSPDGTRFAFIGSLSKPVNSYTQDDLWTVDLKGNATARNLTEKLDLNIGGGVGGDQHPPRAGSHPIPTWTADGRFIIEVVAKEGRANLERFDAASGKPESLTSGDQDVVTFTASRDRSKIAVLISTPTNIGDIFLVDAANGQRKQLTHVNDKLLSQLNLTPPEEIWYTSFDGKKIQAWAQKPPDFDPKKKYPLILNIHGGPHTAYGYTFDHEFQWMAAKGYVVLYPNPRGSTSYGQDFANIIQYRYPGDDYKDLMIGVDELIKRGYIDEKNLGVTGGSGGGVLTNWTIGHTDRFAAAVSQRSIANWADWWYTADFTEFKPIWFRGAPFEEAADFAARSPITFVDKVKTPLMLIEGEADDRTPPNAGGEQMFRALKYRKIPTVMVRFPGETHELSRSGKPWHRVERLEHIVNWFDIYLQGKKIAGYDPVPQAEEKNAGQ